MVLRTFIPWLHKHIQNYNLFIPDESDYVDADDTEELRESAAVLKQQKYTTWLYVFLFISKSAEVAFLRTCLEEINIYPHPHRQPVYLANTSGISIASFLQRNRCYRGSFFLILVFFIYSILLRSFLHRTADPTTSNSDNFKYYFASLRSTSDRVS